MSQTEALIAALWQKNQAKFLAHLDLLEAAAQAASLTDVQRAEAAQSAHKLAGALGMYGFAAATAPARLLERELNRATPDPATLQHLTKLLREVLNRSATS